MRTSFSGVYQSRFLFDFWLPIPALWRRRVTAKLFDKPREILRKLAGRRTGLVFRRNERRRTGGFPEQEMPIQNNTRAVVEQLTRW
jgi:hypothetical protein